jgi:hypothetical protein
MNEFTLEQSRRWDAWQQSHAVSMRRNDRIARLFGLTMLTATLIAVFVAVLR